MATQMEPDTKRSPLEHVENVDIEHSGGLHVERISGSDELAEAKLKNPPKPWSKRSWQLYGVCFLAFFCSSMNGYDGSLNSSISVMKPFQNEFGSDVVGVKIGLISAMYQIGSVCSLPFIASSMDRYGRKFGMFAGCLLIVLGTCLEGTSAIHHSLNQFMAGRLILGFGVGIATAAAPTYVVEIAHPAYRGVIGGLYNCFYGVGSTSAAGAARGTVIYNDNRSWLIPTWVQMVCPACVLILVLFLPESPRYLFTHGKKDKALDFLIKYHGEGEENNAFVKLQIAEFEEQLQLDASDKQWWNYRDLFKSPGYRYRIYCNWMMAIVGQTSSGGIGYFVGAFYQSAGITNPITVLDLQLGSSVVSHIMAFIGGSVCDRVGRRTLFIGALAGITLCWVAVAVGTSIYNETKAQSAAIAGIVFYWLFSMSYATGVTPLQGLYSVEVLAYEQRGKGMALSALVTNIALLVNQFGTPVALQRIGPKTYIIWAVWCALETVVIYFLMVETRAYTLEELEYIFNSPSPRKASTQKKEVVMDDVAKVVKHVD